MATLSSQILRELHELKELVMALTAGEQQAVNALSSAVDTLASDIRGILDALKASATLQQQRIDELANQGRMDGATIAELRGIVAANEADTVGALQPIIDRLTALDSNLHNPETPLTVVEPKS